MKPVVIIAIVAVAMIGVMVPSVFADYTDRIYQRLTIVTVDESGFSQDCVESGCYTPTTATVNVGGVVTMTNTDPTGVHTFTSGTVDGFAPSPDGTFNSYVLMSGDAFEWIPESTGEQPYYCMLHTWMVGTIVVGDVDVVEPDLPLTVEADKSTYGHDTKIIVTGQVANVIPGNLPVYLVVVNPLNSIVAVENIYVSNDGSFTTSVSTAGNLWKYDGTYTIKINYGSLDNKVTVKLIEGFDFTDSGIADPSAINFVKLSNKNNQISSTFYLNEDIIVSGKISNNSFDSNFYLLFQIKDSDDIIHSIGWVPLHIPFQESDNFQFSVKTIHESSVKETFYLPEGQFEIFYFIWISNENPEMMYLGDVIDKINADDVPIISDQFSIIEKLEQTNETVEETVSIPFNQRNDSNNSFQDNGDFYLVYEETNNYKDYEEWVKGWPIEDNATFFEDQIRFLNETFKLPYDVPIIIAECGESNAWYYSEINPSYSEIVICYELIEEINNTTIWTYQDNYDLSYEELTEDDFFIIQSMVIDTVDFILWHELGHGFIDLYKLPITGLEEDVVDQFSAYVLLTTGGGEDVSIYLINAAEFWLNLSEMYEIDESNYSDVHSFDRQRFYNLACYAYGSDSQFNQDLIDLGWVPENRIDYCYEEYNQIINTWEFLLSDFWISTMYDSQSFEQQTEQEEKIAQLEAEQLAQQERIAQLESEQNGGGCLIATATYGSEMAPQVQQLRELRDNQLLQTESGTAFMGTFNDIYYSFSPIIADYERENPYFKEAVKLAITPMISSLSLMENAESESEVLSIGISVIVLNLGMYLGVPAIVIIGIRRKF